MIVMKTVALLLTSLLLSPCLRAAEYLAYIGTYTNGPKSKGIYAYRFDTGTGKATEVGLVAETQNPSFVAIHPNRRFLYSVSEMASFEGQKGGAVSAFAIDRD